MIVFPADVAALAIPIASLVSRIMVACIHIVVGLATEIAALQVSAIPVTVIIAL